MSFVILLLIAAVPLAIFGMIVYYFYKNVRASLLEYLFILVCASLPYQILVGRIHLLSDFGEVFDRIAEIIVTMPCLFTILYGASKGLNWAERRGVRSPIQRIVMMLLGIQAIPAIFVLPVCIFLFLPISVLIRFVGDSVALDVPGWLLGLVGSYSIFILYLSWNFEFRSSTDIPRGETRVAPLKNNIE